jgi:hypothetical protein
MSRVITLSNSGTALHACYAAPLTVTVTSSDAVSSATLSEIMHGVPRRFPFWEANVFFGNVDALNLAGAPESGFKERTFPHEMTAPGIMLHAQRCGKKQWRQLTAALALSMPDGEELAPLPARTQALLDALGKVTDREIAVTPSAADRPRAEALAEQTKEIANRYRTNSFAGRPDAALPRPLPPIESDSGFGIPLILRREAAIPSIKALLQKELRPLGYRYQPGFGGQGCYNLIKRTSQNNLLAISVDASPLGGQFSASFHIQTPFTQSGAPILLPPHGNDYPIDENLADVIANVAYVAGVLEETLVREIEALHGAAPKWFADAVMQK